jgi:hypothetical protein
MTDTELRLIRYVLIAFDDGYTVDSFRWETLWYPAMEALLRNAGESHGFKVEAKREKEWMNPECIVVHPFGGLVTWAIEKLSEGEKNEINRKTGTGPVRIDMHIGDPDRIGTERL